MSMFSKILGACLFGLCDVFVSAAQAADAYPGKTVSIFVGFPPGTSTDSVARVLAEEFHKKYGQAFIVENRPGSGGSIGAGVVARAKPDGYTLLLSATAPMTINPHMYDNLTYNSLKDFAAIGQTTWLPYALVANPALPANNLTELVALVKAAPNKYTYATTGLGTTSHLIVAMLAQRTGMKMVHVPYTGSSQAQTDVASGTVDVTFDTMVSSLPLVKAGKLKALAISNDTRTVQLPDIGTVAEQGFPGFNAGAWLGLFAPAGTPAPIIDQLSADLRAILADPAVAKQLNDMGADVRSSAAPAVFRQLIEHDYAMWGDLVKESGARTQH
jgi:tripartite-type tricarboxylate transporter receptor subunit TctC